MRSIVCELGFGRSEVKYLRYGTVGYLKTKEGDVRECKCMGGKFKEDGHAVYEWKVAGVKGRVSGSHSRLENGIIYVSELAAQRGSADTQRSSQKGELERNGSFSVHGRLMGKYGMGKECFELRGTWDNILYLNTYSANKDHTSTKRPTDFEISVTENGVEVSVPMLDGAVDGIRRYPTAEAAYATMKPLKTYSLDDDGDEDEGSETVTMVRVTIEVEVAKVGKVREMGNVIGEEKVVK